MKNQIHKIFFIFLLFSFVLLSGCESRTEIELYGIKYGESEYPAKKIFYQCKESGNKDFVWMFYLIKFNCRIILVDTGFNDERLRKVYKIKFTDPLILLKDLGIKPSDVTDIIITHSHFDHIGNIDKFPKARIIIQKDEYDYFLKKSKNEKLKECLRNKKNIIKFNQSYGLYGIFEVNKIGGHTVGSSVVSFVDKGKTYVLVGDECYLRENYEKDIPVALFWDLQKNRNYLNKLKNMKNAVILPFHDPEILDTRKSIQKIK